MSSLPASAPILMTTPYDGSDFNSHAFNIGLNEFMDFSSEAVQEFEDHAEMRAVATQIVSRLLTHHDVPLSDARHPFNKFAMPSLTDYENIRRLAHTIMADFTHSPTIRAYVVSFFHSDGCNHEWMDELFDEFLEWVEHSTDSESSDSESSDSESSDSESSDSDSSDSDSYTPPEQTLSMTPPMPAFSPMLLHSSLAFHVDETTVA